VLEFFKEGPMKVTHCEKKWSFGWMHPQLIIMHRAILLDESNKLDPQPLDEDPRPKKWQIEAKPTWHHFGEKNQLVQTKRNELKASELMIWRTQMQARVQGRVQLKDSICFKWVQIVSYELDPRTN
jgi:hypothetical protein